MKRKIIITADGSTTIQLEDWNEQYHSKHGAINEAFHVYIKNGLELINKKSVAILEIGFGTGLNALITLLQSVKNQLEIDYTAVEAYPVKNHELQQLNYPEQLGAVNLKEQFDLMHNSPWEVPVPMTKTFLLTKKQCLFDQISFKSAFDLIYFDAFGPRVQPELWKESIFKKMFDALKNHGILTTYSAKGSVRRAMQASGFFVERVPGPPGKREMLVAHKRF